jgi:uncharacterized protein YceH (UPF0502 family)
MSRTRKLDPVEIRVLGVLLEKEQTTPDQYPLTTNALIAGCNQKTGRDPVTHLSETEVTEALDRLREDVLVWRNQSARAERWEHRLDRRWELDSKTKAVMTLLLLRGPQTPGELRTRSERMHHFDSVQQVEETLERLATGFDAMVCELPRGPGQRESRWAHLESAEDPRDAAAAAAPGEPLPRSADPAGPAETTRPPAPGHERTASERRLDSLEAAVGELRETVATLAEQLRDLRSQLGVD